MTDDIEGMSYSQIEECERFARMELIYELFRGDKMYIKLTRAEEYDGEIEYPLNQVFKVDDETFTEIMSKRFGKYDVHIESEPKQEDTNVDEEDDTGLSIEEMIEIKKYAETASLVLDSFYDTSCADIAEKLTLIYMEKYYGKSGT